MIKTKIKLIVLKIIKREDKALISISTVLKFSVLLSHVNLNLLYLISHMVRGPGNHQVSSLI